MYSVRENVIVFATVMSFLLFPEPTQSGSFQAEIGRTLWKVWVELAEEKKKIGNWEVCR